jgi:lipopolysaccharide export system permease protein
MKILKMQILSIYILKEVFTFFMITLFAFTGVFLTVQMLRLATLVINKGVEGSQVLWVFIALVPTFLEIALPLSALIGVLLAFARLSGDSEIIVLKASGLSFYNLILPIVVFGVVCTLFSYLVSYELKPWGFKALSSTLFDIARTKATAGLNEGIFNNLGTITLYTDKLVNANGELKNVLIEDRRSAEQRKIFLAKQGQIKSDRENQAVIFILTNGTLHEIVDSKYVVTDFDANRLTLSSGELEGGENSQKGVSAKELYNSEIVRSIEEFKQLIKINHGRKNWRTTSDEISPLLRKQLYNQPIDLETVNRKLLRLKTELSLRRVIPFAAMFLSLLALPLGIFPPRTQRSWGAGLSVIIGMLVFVIYYVIQSLAVAIGENSLLPTEFAVVIPNIVTLLIAFIFIKKIGSEKWSSVAEGIFFLNKS